MKLIYMPADVTANPKLNGEGIIRIRNNFS